MVPTRESGRMKVSATAALCNALICLLVLAINCQALLQGRVDPTQASSIKPKQNQQPARLQKQPNGAEGTACGSSDDLALKVEVCAKPLMDLLQGTIEKWPRNDEDAIKLCDSFGQAERCIRDASRKCGKGIQKTIVSTLAHSISRARKRECSRSKAAGIVKTTTCLEREQEAIHNWMKNVTGRLSTIELQMREGEKKINAVCCIVNDIEKEIKLILDPLCAEESKLIVRLYRSVLEDVIELICRNPKCNNYLKGYKISKSPAFDGIISILLRIVFSLDNN